jgi:hypothetical protein
MRGIGIEPAVARDFDAVRQLLVHADLPEAGLLDQFPAAYVVAHGGAEIVGVAGLETYGPAALLRSVAVLPVTAGHGGSHFRRDRRGPVPSWYEGDLAAALECSTPPSACSSRSPSWRC